MFPGPVLFPNKVWCPVMRRHLATAAVLAALLCACGTNKAPVDRETAQPVEAAETGAQPALAEFGETVYMTGENGSPIQGVLTGILYADSHAKDYEGPDKYAVAVAFTLVAMDVSDKLPAPISGHDFTWQHGAEQRASADASDVPWTGCTNAYLPGVQLTRQQPKTVIVDLTVPSKGGTLTWNDEAGPIQWTLPDRNSGTGTEPAAKYITAYC